MGREAIELPAGGERKGRPRRGERAWRGILEQHRRSGMSIEAFCAREGLSRASFGRWRARLGRLAQDTAAESAEAIPGGEPHAVGFVDVGALRTDGVAAEPVEIRLELGGGIVVTIRRG